MPAPPSSATSLQPAHFLTAFAAEQLQAKRVLFLGDVSSGLAEHIASISGRRVYAMDPDAMRVSMAIAAARGRKRVVRFELLEVDVPLRETFDVVFIPDAQLLQQEAFPSTASMLQWAADSLTAEGLTMMLSPNAEAAGPDEGKGALAYLDLYDALASQFDHVTMLGQAPFHGCTIAVFGNTEEPNVTIDSSLMTTAEQPTHYVGIASHRPVRTEAYMVLQTPSDASASSPPRPRVNETPAPVDRQGEQLRKQLEHTSKELQRLKQSNKQDNRERMRLTARVSELEQQLQQANSLVVATRGYEQRVAELERALGEEQDSESEKYQEELDSMLDRIAELEQELAESQRAAQSAQAEKIAKRQTETEASNKALQKQLEAAQSQARTELDNEKQSHQRALDALRERLTRVESEREALAAKLKQRTADADRVTALQKQIATLQSAKQEDSSDLFAGDLKRLEDKLRERGQHIQLLQKELSSVQRTGRELVKRLAARLEEAASTAATTADNQPAVGDLEKLTQERDAAREAQTELHANLQRQEANLAAAEWRIQALEGQLAATESAPDEVQVQLEEALRLAQAEIAQLRRNANRELDEKSS